ncbi:MAG: glycosyltransferase family 4 protein, partial [Halobacteriota archaeon]
MKIGILGTISWRTPPQHYGPWETVVHHLTEGLVERGYDVTLFATGDSITNAKLESVCPHGFYEDESL